MKRQYKILFILAIMLLPALIANAQTEGYVHIPAGKRFIQIDGVPVDASGKIDTALIRTQNDIIWRTIRDDIPNRSIGDGTVYVLKRNHVYIQTNIIQYTAAAYPFTLHIRGEDGPGRLPLILHDNPTGGNGSNFLQSNQNTILENFEWDGQCADGPIANRAVDFRGANTRVIVKGCRFVNDRAGSLTVEATGNGIKLYVYDCLLGNSGHFISQGGNGRALDIRINAANGPLDTVIFKNCTMYNLTDRIVRNMNDAIVNYMELDHNTIINNQGYHGGMQFGNTKVGVITNNIFANPMTFGNRKARVPGSGNDIRGEQQQADNDFAIITHNGTNRIPTFETTGVTMRNNNIFFEKEFLDLFAAHPEMFETPTVRVASDAVRQYLVGGQAAESAMSFTEVLDFDYNDGDHLGSVSSYKDMVEVTKAYIKNPGEGEFPYNWSRIYPGEWNAKYSTSLNSYRAADGGYPLGDLNWFPSDKADWLTNPTAKSAVKSAAEIPVGIEIARAYPNPFLSDSKIDYTLHNDQSVEISIYNYLGQKVKTLMSGNMQQGTYQVTWDGKDNNGNTQPVGVYQFVIKGSTGQVSAKLMKN